MRRSLGLPRRITRARRQAALETARVLLIAAMLIVPAARPFARTPEAMAALAAAIGAASALAGLGGAWLFDTPMGPTIVCVAAGLFGLSALAGVVRQALA